MSKTVTTVGTVAIGLISNPEGHNRPIDRKHAMYLANAIRMHGLQHPIIVVPNQIGGYDIVAGLHRLEACKVLGFTEIECRVLPVNTDQATLLEISISENASRKAETFSETLARIDHIMRVRKCRYEEAAKRANVHKSFTSKCKRVQKLKDAAKELIHQHPDKLGISIAYDVVRYADSETQQVAALQAVLAGELTRDGLKSWFATSDKNCEKLITLKLAIDGISFLLRLPESTNWEQLEGAMNQLKATLLGEKKFKRLICELPNHIGEASHA
ncbi:MAG: ParB/RepB/Spo0J family partition protein [Planctomycetales bacterium]|nr:ParB/RepB/Spo0J family partition protein [Planctomycetales bacterium]